MAGTGKRKPGGGTRRNDHGVDAAARPAVSCMAIATVAVVALLLAASALLFLVPPTAPATSGGGGPRREPVELAMGVAGHEGWMDAVRAWVKLACLRLFRPAAAAGGEPWSPTASVKVAAKKSLEMGKEAVEHTAESAARATEEAVERTAETVRRKVSRSPSLARRRHADL
ncbi:hypothetical protein PR202_gb21744 [Eleusine coracana subsp. coracana]|uniref:Uncharacterized protein n=1 Tax=Eleusine coracana subsp. coracana TaxID=191504 RepID=A0AAV5FDZ2_ELECO|nr:hypothetical protein PR202_gb21744 [Eleusine coracana subsp. coracana]